MGIVQVSKDGLTLTSEAAALIQQRAVGMSTDELRELVSNWSKTKLRHTPTYTIFALVLSQRDVG